MGISINTNIAASRASHFLASNHANLQKSLDRLSSGRRITEPADDAGGLAVAMKLDHSIQGLNGASKNIGNAISFLQVQDGILASAGEIVSRMGELQGMSTDVLKNTGDIDNYEAEFNDLREQLNELTKAEFNGVRLFGDWQKDGAGVTAANNVFGTDDAHSGVTMNVVISEDGTTSVAIGRALLGSALMVNQDATVGDPATAIAFTNDGAVKVGLVKDPAQADPLSLDPADATPFTAAAFTQALENIATLMPLMVGK